MEEQSEEAGRLRRETERLGSLELQPEPESHLGLIPDAAAIVELVLPEPEQAPADLEEYRLQGTFFCKPYSAVALGDGSLRWSDNDLWWALVPEVECERALPQKELQALENAVAALQEAKQRWPGQARTGR
jgi:hypothetical protein